MKDYKNDMTGLIKDIIQRNFLQNRIINISDGLFQHCIEKASREICDSVSDILSNTYDSTDTSNLEDPEDLKGI